MDFKKNEIVVVTKERINRYTYRARIIPTGLITKIWRIESLYFGSADCVVGGTDMLGHAFDTKYLRKATKQERFIYEMNNGPIRAE